MGTEPFSWSVAGTLELGERVQAYSPADVQVGQAGFRPASVVLTNRRLLVVLPIPGSDPVVRAFDRRSCVPLQARERDDSSVLLALRAGGALLGIQIRQWNREEADPMLMALGVEVPSFEHPPAYVAGAM